MFGMIFPLLQISYRSTKFFPLFELAILNDIRSRHISRTRWKLWLINYTLQCIAHKNKSDIYTWTGRQHCNYDKSGCYIKWKYTFFKSTKYNCIMLMQMKKKNNQWCFKVDQCHWSLIMNMTNDLSVFVIPWQVNCGLHKKKKKYTDSQHNMQKNNIKITCQSLAHWVKSPKQASEIRVWTSSFWFKSHEMSNRLLHGFILHQPFLFINR